MGNHSVVKDLSEHRNCSFSFYITSKWETYLVISDLLDGSSSSLSVSDQKPFNRTIGCRPGHVEGVVGLVKGHQVWGRLQFTSCKVREKSSNMIRHVKVFHTLNSGATNLKVESLVQCLLQQMDRTTILSTNQRRSSPGRHSLDIIPGPLTLLHRLLVTSSTMSTRNLKSLTLYMWIWSGSEAMDLSSFSSAFFIPRRDANLSQQCNKYLQKVSQKHNCECVVLGNTAGLTDGVQLNAALSQVLRVENNIILGLSIGYQDSNFARFWTHPNVGSEVVLEDVVKSHSCASETKTQLLLLGTRASPP